MDDFIQRLVRYRHRLQDLDFGVVHVAWTNKFFFRFTIATENDRLK